MKLKFVLCINNDGYQASLEKGKIYQLLEDKKALANDLLKIIDESGEEYLYSKEIFVSVNVPQEALKALTV
jgi:hypothetical protein